MKPLSSPWRPPFQTMVVLVIVLSMQPEAHAEVEVSLQFVSFKNSNNRNFYGESCDLLSTCDHSFVICADKPSGVNTGTTPDFVRGNCAYYWTETGQFTDANIIQFDHDMNGVQNPIIMRIQDWEGGFLLKVKVQDLDHRVGDVVDLIYHTIATTPAPRASVAKGELKVIKGSRQTTSSTSLTVRYTVYCAPDYYAENCEKFCEEIDDDVFGHMDCDDQGNHVCKPGWQNLASNCSEEADECRGNKCKNGASCVDGVNGYTCICPTGYSGPFCAAKIPDKGCKGSNQLDCMGQVGATTAGAGNKRLPLILGVVGGFLLLLILIILIAVLMSRRRQRKMKDQASSANVNMATAGQQTSMTSDAGTAMYANSIIPIGGAAGGGYGDLDNERNAAALAAMNAGSQKGSDIYTQTPSHSHTQGGYRGGMASKAAEAGYMGAPPPYSASGQSVAASQKYLPGPESVDLNLYDSPSPGFDNPAYVSPSGDAQRNVKNMAALYDEPIRMK